MTVSNRLFSVLLAGALLLGAAPGFAASEEDVNVALDDLALSESYRLRCRHLIMPAIPAEEVDGLRAKYEQYRDTRIDFLKTHIEETTGKSCEIGWINGTNPPCDDMMERLADKKFELAGFRPSLDQCMVFIDILRRLP